MGRWVSAFFAGWLFKGGAVGSFPLFAAMDNVLLGVVSFPILWMGGVAKHYEAQRLMYDDGVNRPNLILDDRETGKAGGGRIRVAFAF